MIFFALYITVFLRVRMVEFLFFLLMMKLDYWAVLRGGTFYVAVYYLDMLGYVVVFVV